jgi:hypothetical protein
LKDIFEKTILQMSPEVYWQKLKQCGWLDETPSQMHEDLMLWIQDAFLRYPIYVFYALTTFHFDAECIYGVGEKEPSYYRSLMEFSEISEGVFSPTSIEDFHDRESFRYSVSFVHGRGEYKARVYDSDYFQCEIIELINQAIEEQGSEKRFIDLPNTDQCYNLAFVSPEVFHRAEVAGLIPPYLYFHYKEKKSQELNEYLENFYAMPFSEKQYKICNRKY